MNAAEEILAIITDTVNQLDEQMRCVCEGLLDKGAQSHW